MASSAKRQLPLQLQKLPADHLQKVRDHVQGLLAAGLSEIPDLSALDEVLAANLQSDATLNGDRLSVGQYVQIHSLTGAVDFNGKKGKIVRQDESSGRYVVEVEPEKEQKAFKGANLQVVTRRPEVDTDLGQQRSNGAPSPRWPGSPKVQAARAEREREQKARREAQPKETPKAGDFTVGERVRVGGLNGALDLNGQIAVVFAQDKATGRYLVEFENGQGQKRLQGKNLTSMGVATGAVAAKARMFAGSWL